jgi:hypothetical protein
MMMWLRNVVTRTEEILLGFRKGRDRCDDLDVTPWSKVLLEKLTVAQLEDKFPAYYGNRRPITC